jgi:hypothetical protein
VAAQLAASQEGLSSVSEYKLNAESDRCVISVSVHVLHFGNKNKKKE